MHRAFPSRPKNQPITASVLLTHILLEGEISKVAFLVLLSMEEHFDLFGVCSASDEELADWMGLRVKTVTSILPQLSKRGIVGFKYPSDDVLDSRLLFYTFAVKDHFNG